MPKNIDNLLNSYPKVRPPLDLANQKIFDSEYKKNREGSSGFIGKLSIKLEGWMHRKIASWHGDGPTLEVGAGTLNHLPYEVNVDNYDIVEPYHLLFADKKELLLKVRAVYAKITDIPTSNKYSRIFSIATLEHLNDLPNEIKLMHELLQNKGIFQAAIPTEGGFLWGLAWRLTTGISYKLRTGLSYSNVIRHEHINTESEIVSIIKLYFNEVKIQRFPFNYKHLSFYTYISAIKKV